MTELTDLERELSAALSQAHAAAVEPAGLADRLVAAAAAGRSVPLEVRRPRRWLLPLVAASAVLAVAVATALVLSSSRAGREQPAPPPTPGLTRPLTAPGSLLDVRELGFHVDPGPDLLVTDSWAIDGDGQSTYVKVFGEGATDLYVGVYYQGSSPDLPSTGTSETVSVNGVAGTYGAETRPDEDYWQGHLAWEYAPGSWALVSGRGTGTPPPDLREKILTAARAVRPGGPVVRVPVRFGTVPASLPPIARAHDVNVGFDSDGWSWGLSVGDVSLWATTRVGGECLGSQGQPQTETFTYRGFVGCDVAGERLGLHRGVADVFFDYGPSPGLSKEAMKQLLAELTIASDDPTTWFDLKTSLGG